MWIHSYRNVLLYIKTSVIIKYNLCKIKAHVSQLHIQGSKGELGRDSRPHMTWLFTAALHKRLIQCAIDKDGPWFYAFLHKSSDFWQATSHYASWAHCHKASITYDMIWVIDARMLTTCTQNYRRHRLPENFEPRRCPLTPWFPPKKYRLQRRCKRTRRDK